MRIDSSHSFINSGTRSLGCFFVIFLDMELAMFAGEESRTESLPKHFKCSKKMAEKEKLNCV